MNINGFEWKGKHVLVTGASGFKGSWLCKVLLNLGAEVYGTTRHQLNPISAYSVFDLERQIIRVDADISDRQQVYDMINSVNPDVIFHLAAKALVPISLRDPRRTFEVNLMGTLNIIEACRRFRICNRLLICSTDHVFGRFKEFELPEHGFSETSRVSYGGPYDTSKAAMELAVRSFHYTYWDELPSIGISRCANVFGYGDVNQRRVIPLFLNWSLGKGVIDLKYKKNGRQFIHVTDAIVGYIQAIGALSNDDCKSKKMNDRPDNRSPFTPTFHFAIERYEDTTEPFIRMESLAQIIASIFKTKVNRDNCIDFAPNENKVQALNCENTRAVLNWKARKPLRVGLSELGDWYRMKDDPSHLKKLMENEIIKLMELLTSNTKST